MLPDRTSTQAKRKSRSVPHHSFCTIHLLPNNVKGERESITLSWLLALQAEIQNCFTTKESEDKMLDPVLKPGGVVAGPVYYTLRGDIKINQESDLHSR